MKWKLFQLYDNILAVKESEFAKPLSKRLPLCATVKHLRRQIGISTQ